MSNSNKDKYYRDNEPFRFHKALILEEGLCSLVEEYQNPTEEEEE